MGEEVIKETQSDIYRFVHSGLRLWKLRSNERTFTFER